MADNIICTCAKVFDEDGQQIGIKPSYSCEVHRIATEFIPIAKSNKPNIPASEVRNVTVGRSFKVKYEQTATAKGTLGFEVEAFSDDPQDALNKAKMMLDAARQNAPAPETKGEAKS